MACNHSLRNSLSWLKTYVPVIIFLIKIFNKLIWYLPVASCSNLAEALRLVCICMLILQAFVTVFLYVWITCICLCIWMACTFRQLCSLVADTQACPSAAPTGGSTILSTTIPTQLTPTTVALIKPGTVHSCLCFRPTHWRIYTNTQIHKYTNSQIHKYTNTQIHKYTNTQTHKYTPIFGWHKGNHSPWQPCQVAKSNQILQTSSCTS